ncbi:MAG: GNAT family N-acetyltransferase [Floccifex sp.]
MEIRHQIRAQEFLELRKSVQWKEVSLEILEQALCHSMDVVGIYEGNEIIGMARLVGDGCFKAMLTDVIVKPFYQNQGYGKILIKEILKHVSSNVCIEANPTKGNIGFYISCGFIYNPNEQEGVYLWTKKQ